MKKAWTKDDDSLLREMRGDGCTWKEIGEALGRTEDGAHDRGKVLGLTLPRETYATPKDQPLSNVLKGLENDSRAKNGMDDDAAEAIARRVLYHLVRGSIETARQALEDGWKTHVEQQAELPEGIDLLDEPLASVLFNPRLVNALEGAGITDVGQLLNTSPNVWRSLSCVGDSGIAHLSSLAQRLRRRAFGSEATSDEESLAEV